jgi:hypothetical protein
MLVLGADDAESGHHLGQLRKAGLVISDRHGINVFHRSAPKPCKPCVWSSTRTAARNAWSIPVAGLSPNAALPRELGFVALVVLRTTQAWRPARAFAL